MIRRGRLRRPRLKRRIRRAALRGLHGLQHHYFSLLSAGVLATILALALTSASFNVEGGSRSQAQAPTDVPAQPASTLTPRRPTATLVPGSRNVVYYFVESSEQRDEIAMAIHADITHHTMVGYPAGRATTRVFIVVEDYRDEAEALEFLRQLASVPPADGATIRVVDLR